MRRIKDLARVLLAGTVGVGILLGTPLPAGATGLPERPEDLLLVGDSVTAGVHFLALSDSMARQGWAGQLLDQLGLPPDSPRLPEPYPLDHLALAEHSIGLAGWRYPWNALPALLPRPPLFEAGEARTVFAVPGQTLREFLEQSSQHRGRASSGWTFARLLLPEGLTAIETIEAMPHHPSWVVVFLGANDLLASFGMVGSARAPSPGEFAADYRRLTDRLRACMPPETPPAQLLVVTLPDVTALPFLQPVPEGARDGRGDPLPAGTKASAFLLPFRDDRLEDAESWTPAELDLIRRRVQGYNREIRSLAEREGYGVVDLHRVTAELARDPLFATPDSPWFSPDLHHPSARTHERMAREVRRVMAQVAGVELPPWRPVVAHPYPHAGELAGEARACGRVLTRLSLLALEAGHFPPRPRARLGLELGARAGGDRRGDGALSILLGVESGPGPITKRLLSRGTLQLRGTLLRVGEGDEIDVLDPSIDLELRAGVGVEPLANWRWLRVEPGVRWADDRSWGWYLRGEWGVLFAETVGPGGSPERFELGLRLGRRWGRPGHNGN